jgi:outer membrane protein assembly factor BamA
VFSSALPQVDQGLNLQVPLPGGRKLGFNGGLYNRMIASLTHFMQLPGLKQLTDDDVWLKRKAPNTLVLHGRAGNCLGDMGSYDYFTLGGPYSVRGYSPGELGACRRFVEAAAEVRFPLKNYSEKMPGTLYAFAELGTDLGSSRSLAGSPTEFYRKAGHGATYGLGLKALGACRFEYARDCNAGTGAVFVQWGERF